MYLGGDSVLSKNQEIILREIINYMNKEGIPPTIREISKLSGMKSTSSVHDNLVKIERLGYISRKKDWSRGIRVLREFDLKQSILIKKEQQYRQLPLLKIH